MKKLLLAFQFLTIVPLKVKGDIHKKEIAQSAAFFPLTGAFQGILAVFGATVCLRIFPPEITAGLIILILILSNGGFHLDGLADTFDAVAVKSTGNRAFDIEKRLAVMKDSATGAMGVIAITLGILFKYLLIKNLLGMRYLSSSHLHPFTFLLLMPVVSKWTMTVAMFHGRPARDNGLGKLFIEGITIRDFFVSTAILFAIYGLIPLIFKNLPHSWLFFTFLISAGLYTLTMLWLYLCNRIFGGSTGDTLGSLSEITEIAFLFMVIIWSRLFIS